MAVEAPTGGGYTIKAPPRPILAGILAASIFEFSASVWATTGAATNEAAVHWRSPLMSKVMRSSTARDGETRGGPWSSAASHAPYSSTNIGNLGLLTGSLPWGGSRQGLTGTRALLRAFRVVVGMFLFERCLRSQKSCGRMLG